MSQITPFLIANWKQHGSMLSNQQLWQQLQGQLPHNIRIGIAPPAVYLAAMAQLLQGSGLCCGGQDVSRFAGGAYTGDIAADMLVDVGASFVIVGHSERRQWSGEDSHQVVEKALQAQRQGLEVVLCVGENLSEREQGQAEAVIASQLAPLLAQWQGAWLNQLALAYEPVWAIGTGLAATPEQVAQMHSQLRQVLVGCYGQAARAVRLLYGGSVKANNAESLAALPEVNGFLVGGASRVASEFITIARALA